jgi:hypothetical protein
MRYPTPLASSRTGGLVRQFAIVALGLSIIMMPARIASGQTGPAVNASLAEPPAGEEVMALRRQLDETNRKLQEQQTLLDQQAARFDALERQIAGPGEAGLAPEVPSDGTGLTLPAATWQPGSACDCYPLLTIGGQYRVMFDSADFDFQQATISHHQPTSTFFNQRFRTWLTLQTSENVEAYVQAQMGHIFWGEDYEFPKSFTVAPPHDRAGVLVRYAYLGYHTETLGRLRAGIQGYQDPFGQTLASSDWDFSVGGLSWERTFTQLGDTHMLFGIYELVAGDVHEAQDAFLMTLDLDRPVLDGHSVGLSAYFLPDRGGYSYPTAGPYQAAWDAWVGVRGHLELPVVPLNGFVIYNTGAREDYGNVPTFRHDGVALKGEAGPVEVGPGKISFQTLYSTGNQNPGGSYSGEFRTVAQSLRDNFGAQGYWSYLMLTSPHGPNDVKDLGVSLQNRSCGLFTTQAKYEYPVYGPLSALSAIGWFRSDAPNPANGSTDMGTELGQNFTWDFGGGLKADFGAAVLFTGDFYKDSPTAPSPSTLYVAFTRVQLEF